VAPLEANASNKMWNLYQISERRRPIWNGQSCVVAGNRCARHDDEKSEARGEDSKRVMGAVVLSGDRLQSTTPWSGEPGGARREHPTYSIPRAAGWD